MVFTTTVGFSAAISATNSAGPGDRIVRFCPRSDAATAASRSWSRPTSTTSASPPISSEAIARPPLPVAPSTQIVCILFTVQCASLMCQRYRSGDHMSGLRGRPRDTTLDTAIANATEAVLLSHGYSAVNIDRVAKLAGTTRAAIYRRAKTPGELVVALLVSRFGIDPAPDSGNLREDLRLIQELQRQFFVAPMVQAALAGVLNDVRDDGELGEVFYARFMDPRRRAHLRLGHHSARRPKRPAPWGRRRIGAEVPVLTADPRANYRCRGRDRSRNGSPAARQRARRESLPGGRSQRGWCQPAWRRDRCSPLNTHAKATPPQSHSRSRCPRQCRGGGLEELTCDHQNDSVDILTMHTVP